MTVDELIKELEKMRDAGRGDQTVTMVDEDGNGSEVEFVDGECSNWRVLLCGFEPYDDED